MRRECRERFPRHRLQRKPLVSDPDLHHGTCVTHVPQCMSGLLTRGGAENVSGIPGACATRNFTYLVRGPFMEQLAYELHLRLQGKRGQVRPHISGWFIRLEPMPHVDIIASSRNKSHRWQCIDPVHVDISYHYGIILKWLCFIALN